MSDRYLGDQLQVIDVVLLSDDELVDVALPFAASGGHWSELAINQVCL